MRKKETIHSLINYSPITQKISHEHLISINSTYVRILTMIMIKYTWI